MRRRWVYGNYRDAKAACIELHQGRCAMCGGLPTNPQIHHLVSQKFSKCDLRNMVLVCNPTESDCHAAAHTKLGKITAQLALIRILGQGDPLQGATILEEAEAEWFPKSSKHRS